MSLGGRPKEVVNPETLARPRSLHPETPRNYRYPVLYKYVAGVAADLLRLVPAASPQQLARRLAG